MKSAINILAPNSDPMSTAVLVVDDANTLSFAAAVDPMRAANRMAGRTLFDWSYVTARGTPATLTSAVTVPGIALSRLQHCDLLLIVAGFALERHATPALCASLRRIAAGGTTLAGIDGGPWLMARAGVLDGYSATTHWEDLDAFTARFPATITLRNRFHIDRDRLTCGGALPAIDMMLHLIEARYGAPLAQRVAGAFIHDANTDPARAQIRTGRNPGHNTITAKANALMEETIESPLTLTEVARHCATSPRSLQTQFRARLDTTPQAHYLHLRLTEALRLVTDTEKTLTEIALICGFTSPSSFARAFRGAHGVAARKLRTKR